MTRFVINGPSLSADFGEADLTVKAREGSRVFLVPEGAHEAVALISHRLASKRVPASNQVTFGPLPAGQYQVCVDRDRVAATVKVDKPGVAVRIH